MLLNCMWLPEVPVTKSIILSAPDLDYYRRYERILPIFCCNSHRATDFSILLISTMFTSHILGYLVVRMSRKYKGHALCIE